MKPKGETQSARQPGEYGMIQRVAADAKSTVKQVSKLTFVVKRSSERDVSKTGLYATQSTP